MTELLYTWIEIHTILQAKYETLSLDFRRS